jgi:hypothetical protein
VPFVEAGDVTAAEISGNYAVSVDVHVMESAQAACGGFGEDGVALFRVAADEWRAMPGETFRLRAVDVQATTVAFIVSTEDASAASVPSMEQVFQRAERIINSVEF